MSHALLICLWIQSYTAINNLEFDPTLGFKFGVQESGALYATTIKNAASMEAPLLKPHALWRWTFDRDGAPVRTVVRSYCGPWGNPMCLRWTIHKSVLHLMSFEEGGVTATPYDRFRLEDVHLLDVANPRGLELIAKKYGLNAERLREFGPESKHFNFEGNYNREYFFEGRGPWKRSVDWYRSFWVAPDGLTSEFLLRDKTLHVALAARVSAGRGRPERIYFRPALQLKVEFHEPFLVFADPECHYFVTKSGKVYYVPRLDMPGQYHSEIRPYHIDPARPVRTIVSSPEHMRTFLAGPDGERQFYFELNWHKYEWQRPTPYTPDMTPEYPKPIADVCRFGKYLNDKLLFSMPDEKKD